MTGARRTVITGDRRCTRCGYGLKGQPVVRDVEEELLLVRCPECAMVSVAEEFPLLGRWASLWRWGLALSWLLVVGVIWFLGGTMLHSMCMASATIASSSYADHIDGWYLDAFDEKVSTAPGVALGGTSRGPRVPFATFWVAQDAAARLASVGGVWRAINWLALLAWIPLGLVSTIYGCFWAVVFFRRRWLSRILLLPVLLASTIGFATFSVLILHAAGPMWSTTVAFQQVGTTMIVLSLLWCAATTALGLLLGRPLVRALVRLCIPPRLRGGFSLLWLADGKPFTIG